MSVHKQFYPGDEFTEIEDFKSAFRSGIRDQRATRSERQKKEAAQDFATVLLSIPEVKQAKTVALYTSRAHEPSTLAILKYLNALGKRVLLPILGSGLQRDWAEFAGEEDLQERAPGRPPEPSTPALGVDAITEADVVIVPAIAVDSAGNRLGQGGGWYDRVLPLVRPEVLTIAMVYPEEIYNASEFALPREPHDVPVSAVATTTHWLALPSTAI